MQKKAHARGVMFAAVALLALLDQAIKAFVPTRLENVGAVGSLPVPNGVVIFVGAIILAVVLWRIWQAPRFALALIAGGGISNLADRVLYGHVRDYLPLFFGAVINLADIFIGLGIIILIFNPWRKVVSYE